MFGRSYPYTGINQSELADESRYFIILNYLFSIATGSTAPEIPKDSVKYGMSDAGTTGLLMR